MSQIGSRIRLDTNILIYVVDGDAAYQAIAARTLE